MMKIKTVITCPYCGKSAIHQYPCSERGNHIGKVYVGVPYEKYYCENCNEYIIVKTSEVQDLESE